MILTDYLQRLLRNVMPRRFYCEDALITTHNHTFVNEGGFVKAYARGLKATGGFDYHNRWRVQLALWIARACAQIDGDFVECGVNYGLTSSAIMENLAWNKLGKMFWLVDSFSGLDEVQLTDQERKGGSAKMSAWAKRSGWYNCDADRCRRNFSEWTNAKVVQGWIPQCLDAINSSKIAFLHLDLNSSAPEIAAFKHFSPLLSPGSFVLLDDYGYSGGGQTFVEWNKAAGDLGVDILSLPTGQGLIQTSPRTASQRVASI